MSGKKVLAVDDNPDMLALVRLILSEKGYEVLSAKNGQEALDLAKTENPDTFIVDIGMPVMDGWEMIRRMRQDPRLKDKPVIVVTGRTSVRDKILRDEILMVEGFLNKPFGIRELVDAVTQSIES